jgi:hypothetical protein
MSRRELDIPDIEARMSGGRSELTLQHFNIQIDFKGMGTDKTFSQ